MNTVESSIAFNSSIIPAGIDSPHLPLSSRMKGWRLAGFIASAAVLAWAAAPDSHAATIDWKSAPTNTTWATGSNWDGGIAPANSLTTDIARFNQTSYTSQPNAGTTSIAGIEIGNGTTATANLTLSGTNLSIGASGITKFATSGNATISSPVTLGVAQSWTNNSSTLLTVSGNVTNAGNVLTIGGSGNTTISTGAVSGTGGIIKSGDGTLSMTGTNTGWSGGITIQSGTVSQGTNAASLGTGRITLGDSSGSSNATLIMASSLTATNAITVAAGSSGTLRITMASGLGSPSSYTGAVTLNNQLTLGNLGAAQALNFGGGGITGSSDIVVDSAGAPVVIAGTNNATWTGNLIVHSGTAQLGANTAVPGVVSIGSGATFDFRNNTAAAVRGIQDYSGAGGTVTTPNTRSLTVNGNGSYSFSGNITGANMGFTVALGSAGKQILSGSNSYGGLTTISSGILNIQNSSSLGTTVGSTTVASGATLQLEGGINVGNETLTITGTGASGQNGALVNVSGNNTYGGLLTWNSGATPTKISSDSGNLALTNTGTILVPQSGRTVELTGSGNGSIAGGISSTGGGGLTKNGTGTWTLTGANTYTGATTINAGRLQLGDGNSTGSLSASSAIVNNANLTINRSNAVAQGTDFSTAAITGTGSFTQAGTGTTTLNATNSYTGVTTVERGTLSFTSGAASATANQALGANATVILGVASISSGTLNYTGAAGTLAKNVNVLGNGSDTIQNNGTGLLTLSGNVTNAGNLLTIGGSGNTTLSTGVVSGSGGIIKSGDGTLSMTGTNTGWSGGITIKSGTVSQGTNAASLGTGMITLGDSAGSSNATLMSTTALTVTNAITVAAGSSGTLRITVGSALGGPHSYTGAVTLNNQLTLGNLGASQALNFGAGGITGSSDIIVDSAGAPVVIAGTNNATWTGNLIVKAGTAQLGGNAAVPGVVSVGSGATFDFLNNTAAAVTGIQDYSGAGGTVTTTNSRALSVNGNGSYSFSGNMTGANMGFTVALGSSGVQTLSGSNSYGGATTINSGILNIRNDSALGTTVGSTSVALGATLQLEGGITVGNEALSIFGFGAAGQNGALVNVSGTNSYGGQLTLLNNAAGNAISSDNSGTLNLTNTGTITNGNSRTLFLNGSGNGSLAGVLASGAITKNGTGTWTLTGANTYTGATTISAGTLQIGNGGTTGALSSTSAISNNGTLVFIRTNNVVQGTDFSAAAITGTGNLTQSGTGNLTLNAANSYTGVTTINSGTLIASGGSAIANAGTVTLANASGALFSITGNETIGSLRGGGSSGGNVTIAASRTLTVAETTSQVFSGSIQGSGGLTKNGTGTWTLTGTNTYSGATTINTGTLVLSGTNTASAITVASGATLMGTGSGGATNVSGTIAPGNSPGTLTVGSLTLNSGGVYIWEMADATGVAGTGWDQIVSSGLLTINSTSGSTFAIAITSSGAPSNWSGNSTQSWDIITYGSVSGFDATKFSINATAFAGSTANGSSWTLTDTGSALRLSYSILTNPIWAGGTGNWTTGFSPAITNGVNSTFIGVGGTATNNIVTGSLSSLASITFDATAGAYTLNADSGSSGYDAASAFTLGGNIVNNSTATQTINLALTSSASRVFDAASGNIVLGGPLAGIGGLTKNGSNKLTLSADNTYSGATAINAGMLEIATTGLLGGGSYAGNIVNTGALIIGSNSNHTLSGAISGSGALTKNGTGTLTLSGSNSYSGGTTLNTGTLVIGNAAAAGSGTITQADATSLLKIDTTGTITNDMSVYNVLATQSATLSGAITVNNATWDIDTGDTLTISGAVSGNGGITKNGGGTLILSGNNTYLAPTVINAGTLEAANAGALGSNNTVQVTGGTLLVTADDAINGKNIQMGGSGIGLQFSGNYSGAIGNLTLSANSIIDLGSGSVQILFQGLTSSNHTLSFYNWSGTTLWNGGNGTTDTDKVYFGPDLSDEALAKIYFHSGAVGVGDSFLGSGYDLGLQETSWDSGLDGYHIIPVPEPETYAAGLLLLLGGAWWMWRNRKSEACSHGTPLPCGVKGTTLK
jgi:autotransporter-associated beta strand protein